MNHHHGEQGSERGVGLAECSAALLLLAVAALAGMELVALSVRAADRLQRLSTAGSQLTGRLDSLLALPFDDPALLPGGSLADPLPGYAEDLVLDGRPWQILWMVTLEADGGKLISLRLVRTGESGRPGPRLSAKVYR